MKWTVEYDELTEAYIVQIAPDCFAEVMGRGRKSHAERLAAMPERIAELEAKLTALCSAAIKEAAFIVVERMEFDEDYPASSERMCKSALRLKEAVAKSREE